MVTTIIQAIKVSCVYTIILVFTCIILMACQSEKDVTISLQVTLQAEQALTDSHGVEVGKAIENFESVWSSLNAHKDTSIQSGVATGVFLDYHGFARRGNAHYEEPFWLVTKSVALENVRVVEYSLERFKAVACVTIEHDRVTIEGIVVESLPPYEKCGVYVFVYENDTWLLAGIFDTTMPDYVARDWNYAQDWLKEIIGDLPSDPSMLNERVDNR